MKRVLPALIYTILVDGKPIVALEAEGREAAELCREEWFRADLCALSSNGEPICGINPNCKPGPPLRKKELGIKKRPKKLRFPTKSYLYIWLN